MTSSPLWLTTHRGPRQLRFSFGTVEPLRAARKVSPVRVAADAVEVEHLSLHYVVRPDAEGFGVQLR
jgi:hypothetical protein